MCLARTSYATIRAPTANILPCRLSVRPARSRFFTATPGTRPAANVSREQMRRALFAYYVRPFLRVQENHLVSVREEVWHRASPRLRHLLGADLWLNAIGFVDGPPAAMRKMAFPRRKSGVLS
jgi:hypothetical protein